MFEQIRDPSVSSRLEAAHVTPDVVLKFLLDCKDAYDFSQCLDDPLFLASVTPLP
jgi:hypothetical protein